jgi:nucleoid DNA-binding protein
MRKEELTLKLARTARVTPAEAADRLDRVVHGIVKKLRQGKPATLPGLGKLTPSGPSEICFIRTSRRGRR